MWSPSVDAGARVCGPQSMCRTPDEPEVLLGLGDSALGPGVKGNEGNPTPQFRNRISSDPDRLGVASPQAVESPASMAAEANGTAVAVTQTVFAACLRSECLSKENG